MNENDVIAMRDSAFEIIKKKIDDITINESPPSRDKAEYEAAKREQAQLYALAGLGTSLVFGMLAEVVMMRQALQKTTDTLAQIRDQMQMTGDLRIDDHG